MNPSKRIAISTLTFAVSVLTASQASAQNPGFELGNLFLGFQASGGAGSDKYVLANVGDSALTFRDAAPTANLINMFNVNSALVAQFGQSWFDRSNSSSEQAHRSITTNSPAPPSATATLSTRSTSPARGEPRHRRAAQSNPYSLSADAIQQASNGLYTTGLVFRAARGIQHRGDQQQS
jgi:hypothetical protein